MLGSNQAVNFTAYAKFKELLQTWQPEYANVPIPSYQTTLIGLISGAMGPLSNAPIDTIKTRLQKTPGRPGETAMSRITAIAKDMFKYGRPFHFPVTEYKLTTILGKKVSTPFIRELHQEL